MPRMARTPKPPPATDPPPPRLVVLDDSWPPRYVGDQADEPAVGDLEWSPLLAVLCAVAGAVTAIALLYGAIFACIWIVS